jgi:hypothetical protein
MGAFQDFVSVGHRLEISANESLQVIDSFPWIQEIGLDAGAESGALIISDNPVRELISSLSFGGLIVERNPLLQSLLGFGSLHEISGDLSVSENDGLDFLCAFSGLGMVAGDFHLIADPVLPTCNAEIIRDSVWNILGSITAEGTSDFGSCVRLLAECG